MRVSWGKETLIGRAAEIRRAAEGVQASAGNCEAGLNAYSGYFFFVDHMFKILSIAWRLALCLLNRLFIYSSFRS